VADGKGKAMLNAYETAIEVVKKKVPTAFLLHFEPPSPDYEFLGRNM
jgi:hypothetical protein